MATVNKSELARAVADETGLTSGQAKEAIDKVFAGSEAYDVAEARRVKSRAKSVNNRIEEELK